MGLLILLAPIFVTMACNFDAKISPLKVVIIFYRCNCKNVNLAASTTNDVASTFKTADEDFSDGDVWNFNFENVHFE